MPIKKALRAGMAIAPELAPVVIAVIEKAASGVTLTHSEWQLLFCGLHVLAAAGEQSAYPAVMSLLSRSEEDMVDLFTDEYTNVVARLLLGLFDGDADPLIAALEDRQMDGGARWAVFNALARLTWEGRVLLAVTLDVIDRFEREGLAPDGDIAWEGWQNAIMYLSLEDRADKVRAAWAAGRFPLQREVDRQEWNAFLAAAVADPGNEDRFIGDFVVPITDPVAALTGAEKLGYAPPEMTVSPDGRTVSMKIDQALGDHPPDRQGSSAAIGSPGALHQSWPQRALSLRLGQEVQALLWRCRPGTALIHPMSMSVESSRYAGTWPVPADEPVHVRLISFEGSQPMG